MYKKYFYTAFIVIVLITMVSYVLIRANKNISPAELADTGAVATATPTVRAEVTAISARPTLVSGQQIPTNVSTSAAVNTTEKVATPNITLSVAGSSYAAYAPRGSTVLEAMKILASTTGFSFSGKDYPSLGFFVESMNGQRAENGHNWILYVNGKLSGTGASQTTLKASDALEWRYEKNY